MPEPSARWAGQHLLDTVAALWPDARVYVAPGRRAPGPKELLFVPDADSPRILVPGGHPKAASAAVRRFSHSLSAKDRLKRLVAAAGLRVGSERILSHRIAIEEHADSPDSIESYLSGVLGLDVVVSLGVGSARANQKPVLQVFGPDGRSVAFVKIGDSPRTRALVRGEAACLRQVGEHRWRTLVPPRLLHLGDWNGMEILVISALRAGALPRLRRTPQVQPPLEAMLELSAPFESGTQEVVASSFWKDMHNAVAEVDDEVAERFVDVLGDASTQRAGTALRFGAWHGDWAPWNMAWRRGRVQLWDWERFETDVPHGLDRLHYVVSTLTRANGFTSETLRAALDTPFAREYADPEQQEMLSLSYLAAITGRYIVASQGAEGAVLRPGTAVVLSELSRRIGRT